MNRLLISVQFPNVDFQNTFNVCIITETHTTILIFSGLSLYPSWGDSVASKSTSSGKYRELL